VNCQKCRKTVKNGQKRSLNENLSYSRSKRSGILPKAFIYRPKKGRFIFFLPIGFESCGITTDNSPGCYGSPSERIFSQALV
jgi:hypothetical protein